jgi:serine/threonine protein kinase/tetratricopeptide (TPR) repeat protein
LELTVPDRFKLLRPLGEGGMGVVYEAFDRERNAKVALKTLKATVSRKASAQALLRFKREFRALQDLHHRNLVTLGELIAEGQQWFFTMELVDGYDFLAYVRPRAPMPVGDVALVTEQERRSTANGSIDDTPMTFMRRNSNPAPVHAGVVDEARLRATLPQLAAGLDALHQAGKVHRDIKPSNVRVTPVGRVVLLDFGLVADVAERPSLDGEITGTPAYMAPEQATSKTVGPEADCYALGVVLYEALTGVLPFDGPPLTILMDKQQKVPVPARERAPGVPADLDALCTKLLRSDPATRPTAADVLRMLEPSAGTESSASSVPTTSVPASMQTRSAPFVGRASELEALDGALQEARAGSSVVVLVDGESGVGKSCLVQHFCGHVMATHPDAVVLAGRCYEREQVPYKGLDGVIDELARHLASLPDEQAAELAPPRLGPLVQVFPVLRRSRAFAFAVTEESRDPHDLRRRAFESLRHVLSRIAAQRPLVIAIDDLQWADADSLSLLTELLRPPDAPALLLVGTVRDAPATEGSVVMSAVGSADIESHLPSPPRRIALGRLPDADARELASSLLELVAPHRAKHADAIAREAQGHPLFIDELARHAALAEDREIPGDEPDDTALLVRPALDLQEALHTRIERLELPARKALELVAVAGRPLTQETVAYATGMEMAAFARVVAQLRVAHMVLTSGGRASDRIEPYHERVRQVVVKQLSKRERIGCHRRLALALEAARWPDGEALSLHWALAGEPGRASKYAVAAAHQASEALAFDRAAACWERALKLTPEGDKRRVIRARLGDALANAGRGALAAAAYAKAAEKAPAAEALDLRRKAAEQFLRAGRFDEGIAAVRQVLALLDLRYPSTPFQALVQLVFLRVLLALRGTRFRERDPSLVPARDLTRVDICWSIAFALGLSDHIYGAVFQVRAVLYALRAGEPSRVSRALAVAAGYQATGGIRAALRVDENLARARAIAERSGDPQSIAYTIANSAISSYLGGNFRRTLDDADRASDMFRDRVPGASWEQATMHHFAMMALFYLGELRELCWRQPLYLRDANERGDVYASVSMRAGLASLVWLVQGKPEEARRDIAGGMKAWSQKGCHLEHFYELIGLVHADLYEGRAREALDRVEKRLPEMRRAHLTRIGTVRIRTIEMHGRAALAVSARHPEERRTLLAAVERDARSIDRERAAWAMPLARLLRAGAAHQRGDRDQALMLLREAIFGCETADMALHATAARRRLGQLLGGDEGRKLLERTDEWLKGQGVADADAMTAMIAPGYDAPVNSAGAAPVERVGRGAR